MFPKTFIRTTPAGIRPPGEKSGVPRQSPLSKWRRQCFGGGRPPLIITVMAKYFTVYELTKSATATERGIDNTPNKAIENNIKYLIEAVLDPLREAYGKPVYVSSGYRCAELNKAVGGAKNSQHLTGMAADIYVKGESNAVLYDIMRKGRIPFDQMIIEKGTRNFPRWIHLSISRLNNRKEILYYDGKRYTRLN